MSEYSLVLSSKSRMCDLVILGIDKDIFVKLIFADSDININQMIGRVKSKSIWRPFLKSEYIFYIYDENYKQIEKKTIIL